MFSAVWQTPCWTLVLRSYSEPLLILTFGVQCGLRYGLGQSSPFPCPALARVYVLAACAVYSLCSLLSPIAHRLRCARSHCVASPTLCSL